MGRDGKDKIRAGGQSNAGAGWSVRVVIGGNAGNAGRGWSCLLAMLSAVGFGLPPGCRAAPQGNPFPAARLQQYHHSHM